MQNMIVWGIVGITAQIIIILIILLAIASERRVEQVSSQAARYHEFRCQFEAASYAIEQLPFSAWGTTIPRLEPFAVNDSQVVERTARVGQARQNYAALPGALSLSAAGAPRGLARVCDIFGNIRRMNRWRSDENNIRAAAGLADRQRSMYLELKHCFEADLQSRQKVIAAVPSTRQVLKDAINTPRLLNQQRTLQVNELFTQAGSALDRASGALNGAAGNLPHPSAGVDDGVHFSQAFIYLDLATTFLEHVSLAEAIGKESYRVDEAPLLAGYDDLYQGCANLASLRLQPDWANLRQAVPSLTNQKVRLDALRGELDNQVKASNQFRDELFSLLTDIAGEIMRARFAEDGLQPYLGSWETVAQAWQEVSHEVGKVSDHLTILHDDVQAFCRSSEAYRATQHNKAWLRAAQEQFTRWKTASEALNAKLAEFHRDQQTLQSCFEQNGSTAALLVNLQAAASDCPDEYQGYLKSLIQHLEDLKHVITRRAWFNYKVLSERLEHLEAEGKNALHEYQVEFNQKRFEAAEALDKFQELRLRCQNLKNRTPHFEKDWSTIEQWISHLSGFDASRAGFRAITDFLKEFRSDYETFDAELIDVAMKYSEFDQRVANIVNWAQLNKAGLIGKAVRIEQGEWNKIFSNNIKPLYDLSEVFGRLADRARAAAACTRMEDALWALAQVEKELGPIAERQQNVLKYEVELDDLDEKKVFFFKTLKLCMDTHPGISSESLPIKVAWQFYQEARNATDYLTAQQSLIKAKKYLSDL